MHPRLAELMTYAHVLLGQLTLYEWLLFLGQHEGRHAAQIGEIARRLTAA
jgi:hypothetical protein